MSDDGRRTSLRWVAGPAGRPWVARGWFAEAERWLGEAMAAIGRPLTRPVEQVQVWDLFVNEGVAMAELAGIDDAVDDGYDDLRDRLRAAYLPAWASFEPPERLERAYRLAAPAGRPELGIAGP
jgi:hypothetical protein